MDRRGSVVADPDPDVLACRMVRLGWRTAVVPRRARSLEGVDIVGLEERAMARRASYMACQSFNADYMLPVYESVYCCLPLSRRA